MTRSQRALGFRRHRRRRRRRWRRTFFGFGPLSFFPNVHIDRHLLQNEVIPTSFTEICNLLMEALKEQVDRLTLEV